MQRPPQERVCGEKVSVLLRIERVADDKKLALDLP